MSCLYKKEVALIRKIWELSLYFSKAVVKNSPGEISLHTQRFAPDIVLKYLKWHFRLLNRFPEK